MIRSGQDVGVRFPPSVIYGPDWPFADPLPDEFWGDLEDSVPEQQAAPTTIGTFQSGVSASSIVITTSANIAAGASVMVLASFNGTRTVSSVTDTAGNTYVQAVSAGGASTTRVDIWWCANPVAMLSGNSITVNLSGTATIRVAGAVQVASGVYTLGPTGTESRSSGAGGCSVATNASVNSGSTCIAGAIFGNTNVPTFAGFTDIYNVTQGTSRDTMSYVETGSAGVQTYTSAGTTSNNVCAAIAAFDPPAGAAATSFPPVKPGASFNHMLVR